MPNEMPNIVLWFQRLKEETDRIAKEMRELGKSIQKTGFEVKWIPIESRPMTEEERNEWSEIHGVDVEYFKPIIYSNLPEDEQEVLTCDQYGVIRLDNFINDADYGCYFEENEGMDGIVAWMPLPIPYRGERREDETD